MAPKSRPTARPSSALAGSFTRFPALSCSTAPSNSSSTVVAAAGCSSAEGCSAAPPPAAAAAAVATLPCSGWVDGWMDGWVGKVDVRDAVQWSIIEAHPSPLPHDTARWRAHLGRPRGSCPSTRGTSTSTSSRTRTRRLGPVRRRRPLLQHGPAAVAATTAHQPASVGDEGRDEHDGEEEEGTDDLNGQVGLLVAVQQPREFVLGGLAPTTVRPQHGWSVRGGVRWGVGCGGGGID